MIHEEKQLLLKDLSSRLPYQPLCKKVDTEDDFCECNAPLGYSLRDFIDNKIIIKPYLRPLSSITEEEIDELKELCTMYEPSDSPNIGFEDYGIRVLTHHLSDDSISFLVNMKVINWLNSHHFDYQGLIEKGLAIKVTEDNNPYEN